MHPTLLYYPCPVLCPTSPPPRPSLAPPRQVVLSEQGAAEVSRARSVRSDDFRRMQQAAALHAQRQREMAARSAHQQQLRVLKEARVQLASERKQHMADRYSLC